MFSSLISVRSLANGKNSLHFNLLTLSQIKLKVFKLSKTYIGEQISFVFYLLYSIELIWEIWESSGGKQSSGHIIIDCGLIYGCWPNSFWELQSVPSQQLIGEERLIDKL